MVEKIKVTKVRILKRFFINFIRVGVAFFKEGGRFLGGDKIFSSDRFLEFFIGPKLLQKEMIDKQIAKNKLRDLF